MFMADFMADAGSVDGSLRDRREMHNANALKIGFFGMNCSSARTATLLPERWLATWPDCLKLARMADAAGIDFLLPIGRWKGYGGTSDFHGTTLETVTWACGLLAATQRITIFGTVHAPLFHPVIAAKEFVTADHIGQGRFGLNIVAGWNEDEFAMFGVQQREHGDRYEFAQEWIDVVKRAWTEDEFDFDGKFFQLAGVRAKPKPFGDSRPVIMNAGRSGPGQTFAMRNCDAFFTSTAALRLEVVGAAGGTVFDRVSPQVHRIKNEAREFGREIEVFTQGQVICRPTQRDAEDYHRHANIENADWPAIEQMLALKNVTPRNTAADDYSARRSLQALSGIGGYPFVGTPDKIAAEFADISRAGVRGIAVSFVNYLEEAPYFCAEVLPRLVRMGVRAN
jgi:alkanesulfonate monooxygenase SsuD/methylene tetrahydromethanopterin reductase-like flavin-dependent oxidoreductase (luciferase family)